MLSFQLCQQLKHYLMGFYAVQVAAKAAAMKGHTPQQPGSHHHHNPTLTSFGSDIEMNPNILMSTQSSELDRAANAGYHTSSESAQILALVQENKLLRVLLLKFAF